MAAAYGARLCGAGISSRSSSGRGPGPSRISRSVSSARWKAGGFMGGPAWVRGCDSGRGRRWGAPPRAATGDGGGETGTAQTVSFRGPGRSGRGPHGGGAAGGPAAGGGGGGRGLRGGGRAPRCGRGLLGGGGRGRRDRGQRGRRRAGQDGRPAVGARQFRALPAVPVGAR